MTAPQHPRTPEEQPPAEPRFVTTRHAEGVTTVVLDRPDHRNSLNYELAAELLDAVIRAVTEPATRVVVLTGAGSAFCAGDDIEAVQQARDGMRDGAPASRLTRDYLYLRICEALITARKPVVAGLNGATVGAGTEMACAADYRLASDKVRIGSGLVQVGYPGNAALLPRVVGPARATELFVTGRLADAHEAERIGLVDRVVPHDTFQKELDSLAAALAAAPTKAIGHFKELRERCWGQPAEFALRLQNEFHHRSHAEIEDGREGLDAFLNKRTPRFTGR
ncbi:enoyl-CoA hydratase/isomerase family protein [Streptomyces lonarensis]|uniref:Enoyl-CoA hydratase n=1 Tax=Streptomyces lonarensis TaxID=700599 RepID=A0A7X6CYD4_9ACTN|nr:enoyl-CoA hydratase-related protein [Streptomyces lonarensis]NJQ04847.1 enoyl-CoA hydratase [Streptomyces lonarensis]